MPSPIRRSARGQLPTASSTTSSLSSRQDRSTRATIPPKSGTPKSLSSEDASEPPAARRSQRQPAHKEESIAKEVETVEDADEEAVDEEEITRCICGQPEYPGPPLSEAFDGVPDAHSEDAGGLFILCDGCSVWQHGGCVGIVEESQSPDKYFCEECRPKQHALHTDTRGQRYSLYLPLHPKANRKGSVSKHDDKARKERESANSRASVDPFTGKRRATMRSKEHDDEEEQLKRAIEESKREVDGGKRVGKRVRDDSDDTKQGSKRQRRASESVPSIAHTVSVEDDSDDETTTTTSRTKRAKADAVQSARQAAQQEKEVEREKARADAANRRQERARSRKNEEAEQHDGSSTPKPNSSGKTTPPAPSSQPPSPPPAEKAPPKRGPGKKPGKKLGNNQYTKKNFEQSTSSPHGRKRQLQTQATTGSGDDASEIVVNGEMNGSNNGTGKHSPGANENGNGGTGYGKGKYPRGKKALTNGNGVKAPAPGEEIEKTFTNMHLALKNMSGWVSKQQEDIPGGDGEKSLLTVDHEMLMIGGAVQAPSTMSAAATATSPSSNGERRFEDLSTAEMAIQLQKGIACWQRQWGHMASG